MLPEAFDVRSWLSRMHLGAVLDAFEVRVVGMLPRVAERDRRDTLIELERFDDSHGSHRLASFIWERLEGGADGEVVNQLFEAAGELGQNVVEHAGSPVGGFGDMADGEAIRQAIRWNVSSVPDEGRGQGLPGVVDGVKGLGGTVWIRSGVASRTLSRRQARTVEVSRLQGTIVGARLPCRPGR